jgi:hypothetical protein
MANFYQDHDRKNQATSTQGPAPSPASYPSPHLNFVPEYQVSGYPAVYELPASSNPIRIKFPYVTQWIMVSNNCASSQDVFVSFTQAAAVGRAKYEAAGNSDIATVAISNPGLVNETFAYTTVTAAVQSRMVIKNGTTPQILPIKCSELFIDNGNKAGCTLTVGLTNIKPQIMPALSGSDVG